MAVWKEKFIGYIDILGYSALTKVVESGNDFTDDDLEALARMLGTEDDIEHHRKRGPSTCPHAPCIRDDIDFQLGRFSDCVVVSTEVSPAGIINLVSHCWGTCINLLTRGVMCRGYVMRGKIFHEGQNVRGSGLVDAVSKEKAVSFFRTTADKSGTPFIEIDREVVGYVDSQSDSCVKETFSRMVLHQDGLTAIFPIKVLRHSWIITGEHRFDAIEQKRRNNEVREGIKGLKEKVRRLTLGCDASAVRKSEHYLQALDRQLAACDRTDESIDKLSGKWPARSMRREAFPGLRK